MATIAPQQVVNTGLNPSMTAAAASQTFTPGNNVFLYIDNAAGAPITATVVTPGTVQGQAITDVPIVVTNAQKRLAGPFPYGDFADPTTGLASISWSATTSVTFAVLTL